jgi:thiamine pyrophosphate-dependent acetolactate synthase large subunit-like protein
LPWAQAFYLARTGRPGPVLVDVPKDIQQQLGSPDWGAPMAISGYMSRLPPPPEPAQLAAMLKALKGANKPVSCLRCSSRLTVAQTCIARHQQCSNLLI